VLDRTASRWPASPPGMGGGVIDFATGGGEGPEVGAVLAAGQRVDASWFAGV